MKPKILPIIYVLIFSVVMFVVAYLTGTMTILFSTRFFISLAIFFFGLSIVLISGIQFRNAATTVHPLKPEESSQIVTTGLYRLSRNPMYIGFFLFLVAWAIFLGSVITALVLPFFIFLINRVQIMPEELVLQEKFGEAYLNYKKQVRRWI